MMWMILGPVIQGLLKNKHPPRNIKVFTKKKKKKLWNSRKDIGAVKLERPAHLIEVHSLSQVGVSFQQAHYDCHGSLVAA